MTASMSTVHAVTNTQSVLDSVPGAGTSGPAAQPQRAQQHHPHLDQRRASARSR